MIEYVKKKDKHSIVVRAAKPDDRQWWDWEIVFNPNEAHGTSITLTDADMRKLKRLLRGKAVR